MRKKSRIIEDLLKIEDLDPELQSELGELRLSEIAIEAAIGGSSSLGGDLPVFLVTIARRVTSIPPSGGEANTYTVTKPAVLIIRPDNQERLKGIGDVVSREDLLPSDYGLRVFSNWQIIEVLSCDVDDDEGEKDEGLE